MEIITLCHVFRGLKVFCYSYYFFVTHKINFYRIISACVLFDSARVSSDETSACDHAFVFRAIFEARKPSFEYPAGGFTEELRDELP